METPQPGLYRDVSFDDYSAWQAVNHSILKHFRATPAHAHHAMVAQDEATDAKSLGHLIHMALLEPEAFAALEPMVAPAVDRRTAQGKAEWARFEREVSGRAVVALPKDVDILREAGVTVITRDELETLNGIRSTISQHATAREILFGCAGVNELSLLWQDPEFALAICKGRIDRLCEYHGEALVVDLKTTHRVASTHGWESQIEKYALHEQAAFYLRGLSIIAPAEQPRKFVWIVLETEAPYLVRVFEAEEAALQIGNDSVSKYLATYSECKRMKVWPGWPEGIEMAGLPAWVYKLYDVE